MLEIARQQNEMIGAAENTKELEDTRTHLRNLEGLLSHEQSKSQEHIQALEQLMSKDKHITVSISTFCIIIIRGGGRLVFFGFLFLFFLTATRTWRKILIKLNVISLLH